MRFMAKFDITAHGM